MKKSFILKKPILSEKAYALMARGVYTFLVDAACDKKEVTRVIESQFGVKVKTVNMANFAAKEKRVGKTKKTVLVGGGKKAIVQLVAGQTITLLSPKTESKKGEKKNEKENKQSFSSNKKEKKEEGKK